MELLQLVDEFAYVLFIVVLFFRVCLVELLDISWYIKSTECVIPPFIFLPKRLGSIYLLPEINSHIFEYFIQHVLVTTEYEFLFMLKQIGYASLDRSDACDDFKHL